MSLLTEFIDQVFWFMKESAIYILFGILIAGFLRHVISEKRFTKSFGGDDLKSTTLASLFGIPLPLCSCSVLPMMISLRRQGASKGATTAFLISTPETGVDSISVTYALLDPLFTVARPVAALISALTTGSIVNLFVRRGWDDSGDQELPAAGEAVACKEDPSASSPCGEGEGGLVRRSLRYGFGNLLDDLTPLLILAFLGSGLIAVIIPEGFFENAALQGWPAMFIMLLVGIPTYVCATSSTPIVAALLLKGLSPGAAFVFLLAGPPPHLGTMAAVWRFLRRRVPFLYLLSTAGLTLLMGGIIDSIYKDLDIPVAAIVGKSTGIVPEPLKIAAFAVLVVLMTASAVRTKFFSRWEERVRTLSKRLGIDLVGRWAKAAALLVIAALYLTTCFSVVDLGEVGWLTTFGKVKRSPNGEVVTYTEPGLHLHYPFPFQDLVTGRPGEVRVLDSGFRREPLLEEESPPGFLGRDGRSLEADAEVMNGEESLVSIKYSVQYRLKNAFAYFFSLDDPETLIQGYADASLRTVCACLSTLDILVGHRLELEQESRSRLQSDLDGIGCGVEILRFSYLDVHAPPEVHYAFRDVATAAEDKYQQELKGESAYLKIQAEARGEAYRIEQEAESFKHFRVNEAEGRADAFEARSEAYRAFEKITHFRLRMEAYETVLSKVQAVIPLANGIAVELWLRGPDRVGPPFIEDRAGRPPKKNDASPGGEEPPGRIKNMRTDMKKLIQNGR